MAEDGNFAVDWQSNPEWRTGRIKPANLKEMKWFWFVTLFANLNAQISWPEVIRLITEQGNWGKGLLLSLFPLGGLWLLWFTVRKHLKTRAIATSLLYLPTCPGIIGTPLTGTIELPSAFKRGQQCSVTLSCRKATRSRRGNISEEGLWSEKQVVLAVPGPRGPQLPFAFAVPSELPPSSNVSLDIFYRWFVHVSGDVSTDDLNISFPIPLISAATAAPILAADSSTTAVPQLHHIPSSPPAIPTSQRPSTAGPAALASLLRQVAPGTVHIEDRRDSLVFHYSSKRFRMGGVIGLICAVFAFLFALTIYNDHAQFVRQDAFASIFPAGVGVLFLLAALAFLGDSLMVEAGPAEIEVVRRLFGMQMKHYLVPVSALKNVSIKSAGNAGVGSSTAFFYNVVLQLKSGARITVGDGIKGYENAQVIARIFEQKYGLQKTAVRAEPMVPTA